MHHCRHFTNNRLGIKFNLNFSCELKALNSHFFDFCSVLS